MEKAIPTGSVAQDALRAGFQTTCAKGIATLLKVDDITVEACAALEQKHKDALVEYLDGFEQRYAEELISNFKERQSYISWYVYRNNIIEIPFITSLIHSIRSKAAANVEPRQVVVDSVTIGESKILVAEGQWQTIIHMKLHYSAWKGFYNGEYKVFKEEVVDHTTTFTTNAKKCNVQYIDYNFYTERYIPDDAVMAAADALRIGLTELKVAKPVVSDTVQRDPIITGMLKNQMFIIAWFGYDKTNHLSCNV